MARGVCTSNTCERNTGHGVAVAGAATPEIDQNTAVNNKGAGFWVAEGARPTFGRKNTTHGNAKGDYLPPKWGRGGWFG